MCDLLLPCSSVWSHLHLPIGFYLRKDKCKDKLDNAGERAEDRKERRPVTREGITKVGNGMEGSE